MASGGSGSPKRRLKALQPLPQLRVNVAPGGGGAMLSERSIDRSMPGSPESSMADNTLDMSVMSASDLTSIGFDSTADCDNDAMAETPIRGPERHREVAAEGIQGGGKEDTGGEASAGGDVKTLLSELLKAPIQRGLMLLLTFLNSPRCGPQAVEARSSVAVHHHELVEALEEVATLALKRDLLSRAAALRRLIVRIPAMATRRELTSLLAELRQHARHMQQLRSLRQQFLDVLGGGAAPAGTRAFDLCAMPQVERVLHADFGKALGSSESAVVSLLHVLLLRTPLARQELEETMSAIAELNILRAEHDNAFFAQIHASTHEQEAHASKSTAPTNRTLIAARVQELLSESVKLPKLDFGIDAVGHGMDADDGFCASAGWKVGVVSPPAAVLLCCRSAIVAFAAEARAQVLLQDVRKQAISSALGLRQMDRTSPFCVWLRSMLEDEASWLREDKEETSHESDMDVSPLAKAVARAPSRASKRVGGSNGLEVLPLCGPQIRCAELLLMSHMHSQGLGESRPGFLDEFCGPLTAREVSSLGVADGVRGKFKQALLTQIGQGLRMAHSRGCWVWSLGLLADGALGIAGGREGQADSAEREVRDRSVVSIGSDLSALCVWDSAALVANLEWHLVPFLTRLNFRQWADGGGGGVGGACGGGILDGAKDGAGADGSYVGQVAMATLKVLEMVDGFRAQRVGEMMQRALTWRVCQSLARVAACVAQEKNMYARNRSLRALCLIHADMTRIISALADLTHCRQWGAAGVGSTAAGWGAGAASGEPRRIEGIGAKGGWVWEEENLRAFTSVCSLFTAVDARLVEFITGKIVEQAQLFLDLISANEWASSSTTDSPNEYMQRLIQELLSPALDTLRLGPHECSASIAPVVMTAIVDKLLAHLLKIKARISWQGAKRLQLDIEYLENWIQSSRAIASSVRKPLLDLPVFLKCRQVLALLLPPKLSSEDINASPLPDKHAWVARRSRTKRGLFC